MAANGSDGYVLESGDDGLWRARWLEKTYPLGRDKGKAEEVVKLLNHAVRPNVTIHGDALVACLHEHAAETPCQYITLLDGIFG